MKKAKLPPSADNGCILFDWGDTLMRDFREFSGPMASWPEVRALPGAGEVLSALRPHWRLALATNAADSSEAEIRDALERVDLSPLIDKVYCFRRG